jgi:transposase
MGRLTERDKANIELRLELGEPVSRIAEVFQVSASTVRRVQRKKWAREGALPATASKGTGQR